jgi:hypothetical protein
MIVEYKDIAAIKSQLLSFCSADVSGPNMLFAGNVALTPQMPMLVSALLQVNVRIKSFCRNWSEVGLITFKWRVWMNKWTMSLGLVHKASKLHSSHLEV